MQQQRGPHAVKTWVPIDLSAGNSFQTSLLHRLESMVMELSPTYTYTCFHGCDHLMSWSRTRASAPFFIAFVYPREIVRYSRQGVTRGRPRTRHVLPFGTRDSHFGSLNTRPFGIFWNYITVLIDVRLNKSFVFSVTGIPRKILFDGQEILVLLRRENGGSTWWEEVLASTFDFGMIKLETAGIHRFWTALFVRGAGKNSDMAMPEAMRYIGISRFCLAESVVSELHQSGYACSI